jgi:hypothetical protein
MTDSPPGPVHQPGHRRWSTHLDPHHPSTREPPTFPLRLNSVRREALASRTFGRFAVERAQNRRRTARRKIKPGRIPVSELTVPAPSGMTARSSDLWGFGTRPRPVRCRACCCGSAGSTRGEPVTDGAGRELGAGRDVHFRERGHSA